MVSQPGDYAANCLCTVMAFSPGSWMIGLQLGGQQKRACRAVGLQGGPGLWLDSRDARAAPARSSSAAMARPKRCTEPHTRPC